MASKGAAEDKQMQMPCPYQVAAFCGATKRASPGTLAQNEGRSGGGGGELLGHATSVSLLTGVVWPWTRPLWVLRQTARVLSTHLLCCPAPAVAQCRDLPLCTLKAGVCFVSWSLGRCQPWLTPVTPGCADPPALWLPASGALVALHL